MNVLKTHLQLCCVIVVRKWHELFGTKYNNVLKKRKRK